MSTPKSGRRVRTNEYVQHASSLTTRILPKAPAKPKNRRNCLTVALYTLDHLSTFAAMIFERIYLRPPTTASTFRELGVDYEAIFTPYP